MAIPEQISWYSDPRKWFRAVLMLDDSSHRIALGAAVGMFIAMTPTVGIQMLLVLALALMTRRWFRFNKVAALLMVYVSNPLTVVPLYWFNYKLGEIYFPGNISRQEFEVIFQYDGLSEWWASITKLFIDVGVPLVVGSLVMGTVCALATYPIMLRLIRNLRRAERQALKAKKAARRRERKNRKAQRRDQQSSDDVSHQPTDPPPHGRASRSNVGVERRARV